MSNCDHCWTDSVRNGRCTEPACTHYGKEQKA